MIAFTQTYHIKLNKEWEGVTHICICKQRSNNFKWWLRGSSVPSHYLNQCWVSINWIFGDKILFNLKWNTIYIQGKLFENGGSTITTILFPSLRVNSLRPSDAYMREPINHHWFRQWLVASPAPSHYLNHCWNIVNRTLGDKLQWNCNRNSNIFIQENAFENVVCEMASILSRPQCVDWQN